MKSSGKLAEFQRDSRSMLNNTVAVPRRSVLSDEIYLLIRKMIFNYEILPGAKVNIDALAKKLDVSQTPVREALSRLESDGLIVKEPLKGFRATDLLTIQQLSERSKNNVRPKTKASRSVRL